MPEPILAGIPAGGLKETYEVKILICYLLDSVGAPLTLHQICEICTADGVVDYFTLCTAMRELEENGNLVREKEGCVLTDLGRETVENLKKALPSSLRDAIVRRGMALLARMRREKEVTAEVKPDGSGYQVICSLHEGSLTFFSMAFYAPDRVQADIIAGNFRKKAPELYESLIGTLIE